MITLRPAEQRGHAEHDWLDTWHTFSFNTYHDRNHMGFRALRVINDDIVAPAQGFGFHPHRDMEIITYVLSGELEHKDSLGNGSVVRPGDIQFMSAGNGVMHSEFNPSKSDPVHLLQIWISPKLNGGTPSYAQRTFGENERTNRFALMASGDGRQDSFKIKQDASVYAAIVDKGANLSLPLAHDRYAWLHVATGRVTLGEHVLKSGDGVAISKEANLSIVALEKSELLLFDLA
jgi:redox-sensitive bicupin YhaK (pirin superfamily)